MEQWRRKREEEENINNENNKKNALKKTVHKIIDVSHILRSYIL